jgi:signal transduction histidine kinase
MQAHQPGSPSQRVIEHALWRADGSHFLASLYVAVLHDHQHYASVPGTRLCVVQDITAQRQHKARRVERMRLNMGHKLTNIIAHEVNTPLQTIISSLALMQDSSEEERTSFMQLAQQEVARIGAILHRMKSFYHDISDAYAFIDINQALDHVLMLSGARMLEHRMPIERDFAADLPQVYVSSDQIMQALLHLVLNAVEAMPQGGRLRLASRKLPQSKQVQLAISDTGSGIAPELQALIFDPFFTTKDDAAGLGLFMSQQIIIRHGGTLEIHSQPDEGTQATIRLPYG